MLQGCSRFNEGGPRKVSDQVLEQSRSELDLWTGGGEHERTGVCHQPRILVSMLRSGMDSHGRRRMKGLKW